MSTVTSGTTSDTSGSTSNSIDSDLLYAYYDEYGNLVNENGYLLDEDGNLVVSADDTLTAAYSIADDNGNVYVVSDTASVVNGMILSAIDSSKGEDTVDVYGNSVDSNGYLIDQADSEGGLLTLSAASDLTITEVQSATVTDSDGNEVTVTDGSVSFYETSTGSGVYYVVASGAEATYYDSNDQLLYTEDGTTYYLADSTGSASYTTATATEVVVYSDGTNTYTSLEETSDGSGTYYVTSDLAGYYVVGSTTLTSGSSVYFDGTATYYILGTSTTLSVSTSSTGLFAIYTGASSASTTMPTATESTLYYATGSDTLLSIEVTSSSGSHDSAGTAVAGGSAGWFTWDSSTYALASVTDVSDLSTGTVLYYYDSSSASTYTYVATVTSVSNGIANASGGSYSSGYYYTLAGTYFSVGGSTTWYTTSDSGELLDSDGNTASAATASGTYSGYQLAYDSNGNWVTATAADGTSYYLASASDSSIVQLTTEGETKYYIEVSGVTYYGEYDETNSVYTNFVSTVDEDKTTYGADGLLTDSEGYVIDTKGNQQTVEVETVCVYTVSGDEWDEDGYTGNTVTYTYYFGSATASEYVNSDTQVDDEDESQGYYVQTGVMTTLYYDYNGNTVNSAGYIIDATTGNIVTTSATALTAGYSFTSLNGITYTVSGAATIDATTGIVYSGVSETRYYVDDNDNDVIDSDEDEVTSDGLWLVIRNDAGEITEFQEVGNTKTTMTAEEGAALYGYTSVAV